MLVLTRKKGEDIVISVPPSDKPQIIRVKVTKTSTSTTSLGFTANKEVKINREELTEQ